MDARSYLSLMDHARLAALPRERDDEYEDILALLLEATPPPGAVDPDRRRLAAALALGSMGQNHLWQDLGLPSREVLGCLMADHFPSLVRANQPAMRWKKFFYKQLCDRAQVRACRAPSCGVCASYGDCFGSEEGAPLVHFRPQSGGRALPG